MVICFSLFVIEYIHTNCVHIVLNLLSKYIMRGSIIAACVLCVTQVSFGDVTVDFKVKTPAGESSGDVEVPKGGYFQFLWESQGSAGCILSVSDSNSSLPGV